MKTLREQPMKQIDLETQPATHHERGVFEGGGLCGGLGDASGAAVSCCHRLHLRHRLHHRCDLMKHKHNVTQTATTSHFEGFKLHGVHAVVHSCL